MSFRKLITAGLLSVLLSAVMPLSSAQASPVITGTVPTGVASGDTADFPIALSGVSWDNVLVTIVVDTGGLAIDLVGDTAESPGYDLTDHFASTQSFYGTFASVSDVLNTGLTWYAPSTPGTHDLHFTITVQEEIEGLTFNPANGHYYLVPHETNGDLTLMTGANAFAAADEGDFVYAGMTGYLVEISDSAENDFVAEFSGGNNVWIGASSESSVLNSYSGTSFADNTQSRGKWYWVHSAQQFAEGLGGSIAAIDSAFMSFAHNEPNDSGSNERCLVTNWQGSSGLWNDLNCVSTWSNSMVIEFEGEAAADSVLTLTDADIEATPDSHHNGSGSGNGGTLAFTGFDVVTPLALAIVIIAVGFVAVRRARRTR